MTVHNKLVIVRVAFATRGNLVYSRLVIARFRRNRGNLGMGHNYSIDEFFFSSVFGSGSVVCGLLHFVRNDKGEKGRWIPFVFCFCIDFLWFVDCFVVLLLAMTVYTNLSLREPKVRGNLVYFGLVIARLWKSRGNLGMVTTTHNQNFSLWRPKICGNLSMGHQGTQPTLSLREPKVRGNLGMGHNYSIDDFFSLLFLYLLLVVNSFSFLFLCLLLVVVDCFVVSLLAMTVYTNLSLRELLATRGNLVMATTTPNPPVSLREPKVRGNLGIWHNYSIDEFFSFLFLYLLLVVNSFSFLWINKLLVVVDCFASLAMTVYTNLSLRELLATRGNLVYFGLVIARLWKSRGNLGMATTTHNQNFSLWRPKACGSLSMGHQGTQPTLSLREPKVRGNLGMGHNYSIDEFFSFLFLYLLLVVNSFYFLFLHWLFVICGLPQAFGLRNDKGDEWRFMNCFFARNDEKRDCFLWFVDCFASLAMTVSHNCHCETSQINNIT